MNRCLAFVLALLVCGASARADKPLFQVDLTIGWGGCYRPMEWTPIDVQLNPTSELKKPLGGELTFKAAQDDLTEITVRRAFVLTPGVPSRPLIVSRLAYMAASAQVRVVDSDGHRHFRHEYDLSGVSSSVTTAGDKETLIGVVGRPDRELLRLADYAHTRCAGDEAALHVGHKYARHLPADWTGYASLDLLVLNDVDFREITETCAEAILAWVRNGGRLLIVLGGRTMPAKHPLAKGLPFGVGPAVAAEVPGELLALLTGAEARPKVATWSVSRTGEKRLGWGIGLAGEGNSLATERVGFGFVGVLGFSPSAWKTDDARTRAAVWTAAINCLLLDGGTSGGSTYARRALAYTGRRWSGADGDSEYYFDTGPEFRAASSVLERLLAIRELRPLSIWWVIGLLVVLTILLGPVEYLLLRRLGRLPWTWVTSAAWIAVFTVGAYFGVRAIRAGRLQVRAVSVIDAVDGQGGGWVTTYAGLFAPDSDEYDLTDVEPQHWWSPIAPVGGEVYFREETNIGRQITLLQSADGGSRPVAMPISIWSMQCLLCERPATSVPISATLYREGGQMHLTITNHSDSPISGGYVRVGRADQGKLPPVAPKQTRQVSPLRLGPAREWSADDSSGYDDVYDDGVSYDDELDDESRSDPRSLPDSLDPGGGFDADSPFLAHGCVRRTRGIQAYLRAGAAVICARFDNAPLAFVVRDRTAAHKHVQIVRLVVFPSEGKPE